MILRYWFWCFFKWIVCVVCFSLKSYTHF